VQSLPRRITCCIPPPQHRKINCSLQNALAEKAAWWAANFAFISNAISSYSLDKKISAFDVFTLKLNLSEG